MPLRQKHRDDSADGSLTVKTLQEKILSLKSQGVCEVVVVQDFIQRRVLPFKAHTHPAYAYIGKHDGARMLDDDLLEEEINARVVVLCDIPADLRPCNVVPCSAANPPPQVIIPLWFGFFLNCLCRST